MITLLRQRTFVYGTVLAAGIFGLGIGQAVLQKRAEAQGSTVQAPMYEVDPLWPKPLPNNSRPELRNDAACKLMVTPALAPICTKRTRGAALLSPLCEMACSTASAGRPQR